MVWSYTSSMIKTDSITQTDKRKIHMLIDESICRSLGEDFGLYEDCQTDEDFEKADSKHRELVQYLINSLTAMYLN